MITVLTADDADPVRAIMRSVLSNIPKLRVSQAENGMQALAMLKTKPHDILITDWNMPDLSGIDLVRIIRRGREERINRYMGIIMLTGHAEFDQVLQARDAGVDEFIVKPIRPEIVYLRMDSVINRRRRFISTESYFGPDRRRQIMPFNGPERRQPEGEFEIVD